MSLAALVLGLVALLLHLALTVAAAPVADALTDRVAARLSAARSSGAAPRPPRPPSSGMGIAGAVWQQVRLPWRRLGWLMGKEPVLADNASALGSLAPIVAVAVTLAAAALVPSFCIGMPTGPIADLPTILALLGLARLTLLLGSLDVGSAGPGLAAVSRSVAALLALPGALLALAAFWLTAGSTSLEAILSEPQGGASIGPMPALLAASALGLAALSAGGDEDRLSQELAGPDLALFRLQAGLQRLVWIELVTALLLPGWLAETRSPLHWLPGLLLWALRVAAGCLLLGMVRGWLSMPRVRGRLALASALFGLLAPLLLIGRGSE